MLHGVDVRLPEKSITCFFAAKSLLVYLPQNNIIYILRANLSHLSLYRTICYLQQTTNLQQCYLHLISLNGRRTAAHAPPTSRLPSGCRRDAERQLREKRELKSSYPKRNLAGFARQSTAESSHRIFNVQTKIKIVLKLPKLIIKSVPIEFNFCCVIVVHKQNNFSLYKDYLRINYLGEFFAISNLLTFTRCKWESLENFIWKAQESVKL